MPSYDFKCDTCSYEDTIYMDANEYGDGFGCTSPYDQLDEHGQITTVGECVGVMHRVWASPTILTVKGGGGSPPRFAT